MSLGRNGNFTEPTPFEHDMVFKNQKSLVLNSNQFTGLKQGFMIAIQTMAADYPNNQYFKN